MKLKLFFLGFKDGFQDFGHLIAIVVNYILLSLVYVVGVGVTAGVAKIIGKHFLDLKVPNEKKSYWTDLNLGKEEIENYYRQF